MKICNGLLHSVDCNKTDWKGIVSSTKKLKLFHLIFLFFTGISFNTHAQELNFLSRVYFPGYYGKNFPISKSNLKIGTIISSGIEYRLDSSNLFFRFNYDALSNKYQLAINQTTNAIKSNLKCNMILVGAGDRIRKRKTGVYGLAQFGTAAIQYPKVFEYNNAFRVDFKNQVFPVVKLSAGYEYYIIGNIALSFEPDYTYTFGNSVFWKSGFQNISFKLGFTTSLD